MDKYYDLSVEEKVVLNFIKKYMKDKGYAPTQIEVAVGVIESKQNVFRILNKLQQKGYVRREKRKPRTMAVKGLKMVEI